MLPGEMLQKLLGPAARELGRWLDTLNGWQAVLANDLDTRRGTRVTAYRNTRATTVATSFEALPEMSLTLAGGAGDLLVWFQDSSESDGAHSVTYGLFIDGTQVNGVTFTATGAGDGQVVGLHHLELSVGSGTHTVAVQWKVSGGTGQSNAPDSIDGQTRLTVAWARW